MSVETQQPVQPKPAAPPPPAPPPAPQRSFFSGRRELVLGALVVVGLLVAAVMFFKGGNDKNTAGTVTGPNKANAFKISYPNSWQPQSTAKAAAAPGHPLAIIRQKDGKGYVIIRREKGNPPANLAKLGTTLGAQLQRRIPDLKLRSSKTVKIRSGTALFTSYIRKKTGTVQSVVVVPAGSRTFTINTISRGGANDVAREIGKMIVSFDAR